MKYLILIAILLLSGCATAPVTKPEIRYVDKVVTSCPAPPVVSQPRLLVSTLTDADKLDAGKVAQYYNADIETLLGLIDQYTKILKKYEDLTPKELK